MDKSSSIHHELFSLTFILSLERRYLLKYLKLYQNGWLTFHPLDQIDNEAASPVDIAKTYMTSRPPWASPFAENIELHTPSTIKSQLSGKGTLFSADDQYPSSKVWCSVFMFHANFY